MSDQRRHSRSLIHTPVEVLDIESGVDFHAESIDVSPGGLAFHAPMEPALGADMEVTFANYGTGPARFIVTRIERRAGGYDIAGTLQTTRA